MDGSRVIFMIMLILMPLLLSAGIALPFLADSHSKEKALRHAYDTRGTTRKRAGTPAGPDRHLGRAFGLKVSDHGRIMAESQLQVPDRQAAPLRGAFLGGFDDHTRQTPKVTAPSVGPVTARTADPERRLLL